MSKSKFEQMYVNKKKLLKKKVPKQLRAIRIPVDIDNKILALVSETGYSYSDVVKEALRVTFKSETEKVTNEQN